MTFTKEEIEAAQLVKQEILNAEDFPKEIQSIYMSGEICMWVEMQEAANASCKNSAMDEVHTLVHEADFHLSNGDIEQCRKLLRELDVLSHDEIGRQELPTPPKQ